MLPSYVIKNKELGKGAFGSVYSVQLQDRTVALKSLAKTRTKREQWMREMWMIRELESSLKTPLYIDADEDNDAYYIFMELIQGNNAGVLYKDVRDGFNIPEDTLRKWTFDMLTLIQNAKEKEIYLNDIKPGNMVVTLNSAKMVDMGSCRSYDDVFVRSIGTPYYYAPEKLDHDLQHASDIWSLGISIYMLACGYHPYIKGCVQDYHDIKTQILTTELSFDQLYWKDRSENMKDLLQKMLNKSVHERNAIENMLKHPWF